MSRRRAAFAVAGSALIALCVAVACSSFNASNTNETIDAAADANTNDSNAPVGDGSGETGNGGDGGDVNLFLNSDFADGCANWNEQNGDVFTITDDGHSNLGACRICKNNGNPAVAAMLIQSKSLALQPGDSYRVSFWLKASDAGPPPSSHQIIFTLGPSSNEKATAKVAGPSTTTAWVERSLQGTVGDAGGESLRVELRFFGDAGVCALVDDALLIRQ